MGGDRGYDGVQLATYSQNTCSGIEKLKDAIECDYHSMIWLKCSEWMQNPLRYPPELTRSEFDSGREFYIKEKKKCFRMDLQDGKRKDSTF